MSNYVPPSLRPLTGVSLGVSEEDIRKARATGPVPSAAEIVRTSGHAPGLIALSEFDRWKRLRQVGFL